MRTVPAGPPTLITTLLLISSAGGSGSGLAVDPYEVWGQVSRVCGLPFLLKTISRQQAEHWHSTGTALAQYSNMKALCFRLQVSPCFISACGIFACRSEEPSSNMVPVYIC